MAISAQAQVELAEMALALAHNPKTRAKFAEIVGEAGLPYKFNDVEAAKESRQTAATVAKDLVREEMAAARRAEESDAVQRRMNAQRASLIKSDDNPSGRFDEATVKDRLEPFMQAQGLADYNDAAILFAHHHPEAVPRQEVNTKGVWDMPSGDWLADPRGTARKMAYAAVGDIIAKRR
jgi:hypothetical protein